MPSTDTVWVSAVASPRPGDAEVEHLDRPVGRHHHVARLDVAVNDARARGQRSSTSATCAAIGVDAAPGPSGASSGGSSARLRPCTHSMTMNRVSPSTPVSYTVTTPGWLSAAAARASRSNLAAHTGSLSASAAERTLIATVRPEQLVVGAVHGAHSPAPDHLGQLVAMTEHRSRHLHPLIVARQVVFLPVERLITKDEVSGD